MAGIFTKRIWQPKQSGIAGGSYTVQVFLLSVVQYYQALDCVFSVASAKVRAIYSPTAGRMELCKLFFLI